MSRFTRIVLSVCSGAVATWCASYLSTSAHSTLDNAVLFLALAGLCGLFVAIIAPSEGVR
jgi:hypothetical protein